MCTQGWTINNIKEAQNLISKFLKQDPNDRIDLFEIMNNHWMNFELWHRNAIDVDNLWKPDECDNKSACERYRKLELDMKRVMLAN